MGRRETSRAPTSRGAGPGRPGEYAATAYVEAQTNRHRFHEKLMKAFLRPEVFEGTVVVARRLGVTAEQLQLGDG